MTLGVRWRKDHHAKADVTSAYDVESFARQADMESGLDWLAPSGRWNVVRPAAIRQAFDGSQASYGGYEVAFVWSYLTPDMAAYLFTTMMGGAYSCDATIRVPNSRLTSGDVYYQCTALFPSDEILDSLEVVGEGWADFPIRFVKGVEVT